MNWKNGEDKGGWVDMEGSSSSFSTWGTYEYVSALLIDLTEIGDTIRSQNLILILN